jgi:hypothetical protein
MHSRDIEKGASDEEKHKVALDDVKPKVSGSTRPKEWKAIGAVSACILYSGCSVGMVLSNKALASR